MIAQTAIGKRILFDGNSLTEQGAAAFVNGQRYPTTCYNSIISSSTNFSYHNYAVGGKTTQELTSDFSSKFGSMCRPNDILVFWEICNDAHNLTIDTNGTQLYSNVVAYCNQAKALGLKVIVLTGIARDYPAYDDANITDRIFACNALIRSNWATFCDAVADVAANAAFDSKSDTANTTYYHTDRTHLTNVGYDLVASIVAPVIQSLL